MSFELGIILGFACDFELFSCELQQTSKLRRLWRLAVATQPTIASISNRLSSSTSYGMRLSPFGELLFRWMYRTNPQLRCFAACSGFHDRGPAPRNLQLILNLLAFVGAWLRRDAIASYVCLDAIASYVCLVCCN